MSSFRGTQAKALHGGGGDRTSTAKTYLGTSAGEDYASYVTRIEKTTSMVEGPHFPNLHAIYKHKEGYEEEERCRAGRFGKAIHLERLDDNKKATYYVN